MKCLILAAGYATRLYPLTENFPKPLLDIGGKTILDWLVDDIDTLGVIDEYIVISNHKFVSHFEKWAKRKTQKIVVVDDGTETNETRLGAVRDINFAIQKLEVNDDILVIAGDNVLDFSLTEFIKYAMIKKTSCVMRYYESDLKKLSKSGVLEITNGDRVLGMQEKPENPKSNWCCPPFYYYVNVDARNIEQAIMMGCGVDAPGDYIAWLSNKSPIYAMEMPGKRYDVGNLESYEQIKKKYKGIC